MKRIATVFLFGWVALSLSAQDVPQVQRPLLSKVAATWCPPCGGWGWDFFEHLIEDNDSLATLIVAHHSGDLVNPVSQAFSENYMAPYQPYFYLNIDDQQVNSSNAAEKRVEVKNAVQMAHSSQSPIVGALINASENNGELHAEVFVDFFEDVPGDYYMGVYVVEDGIVNNQEGQGANAVHDKILRGAFSEAPFGVALNIAAVVDGVEIVGNYYKELEDAWNLDNLEIIAIIWEKIDGQYFPVNTSNAGEINVISSIAEINFVKSMSVVPNLIEDHALVEVELDDSFEQARLSIFDVRGKPILVIHEGSLQKGMISFRVEKEAMQQSGAYFVVLEIGGNTISKKMIVN